MRKLQAAREELAAGAGLALATWSQVEFILTHLFVSVLSRSQKPITEGLSLWENEEPQRRIYHAMLNAVVGFDVRVDLISAAISESDLRKDLKAMWPGIAKRLKKGYKSRHEAAHFIFDQFVLPDRSIQVLIAPFPTTVMTAEDRRLNRQHLDHKTERFNELGEAIDWFRRAVEIQRRRAKGPRAPAPALIQRVRQALKNQTQE